MGRQHVVGQVLACLLADALDQGLRGGALLAHHIGHQLLACTGILDQHGGIDHAGHGPDGLLDLAQLDAEAPDLDLVVGPAYVLDVAVRHLAHQVPVRYRRPPPPSKGSATKRSAVRPWRDR